MLNPAPDGDPHRTTSILERQLQHASPTPFDPSLETLSHVRLHEEHQSNSQVRPLDSLSIHPVYHY